jgi:transcription termination/antitermination protein NusG
LGNRTKTEGGEALLEQLTCDRVTTKGSEGERAPWYALWTHSHCEQLVYDQLAVKGFDVFLPKIEIWSRRAGVKHRILTPMFPGYLFVRGELHDRRYAELLTARRLVCVLSNGEDGPAPVPDQEINAIRAVVESKLRARPHPYLQTGQRVRITGGPLADVEGILVERHPSKGLLVLSVHLFQRSVAVEVDSAMAIAA